MSKFIILEEFVSEMGNGDSYVLKTFETREEAKKVLDEIYDDFVKYSKDLSNTWKGYVRSRGFVYDSTDRNSCFNFTLAEEMDDDTYMDIDGLSLYKEMLDDIQDEIQSNYDPDEED